MPGNTRDYLTPVLPMLVVIAGGVDIMFERRCQVRRVESLEDEPAAAHSRAAL